MGVTPAAQEGGATVIESWVGSLTTNGTVFFSFTVPTGGPVSVTLLSLTVAGVASPATLTLGLGVPRGTVCQGGTASAPATAGVTPQLTTGVSPGVYCLNLIDPGALPDTAQFAIDIGRPR